MATTRSKIAGLAVLAGWLAIGSAWASGAGMPDGTYHAQLLFHSNALAVVAVPVALTVTSDMTDAEAMPSVLSLGQNYPNPFNPKTSIGFALPNAGVVTLEVFSAGGQKVATLISKELNPGQHSVTWGGQDDSGHPVGTGVYFYRLQAEDLSLTRKMLLIK